MNNTSPSIRFSLHAYSYLDPEVKEDARQRKLKLMLASVGPAPMVLSWHCVLCKRDYDGEKHCRTCGTGIYSTELNLKTASSS
ncbi:hypothetical protein JD793_002784 [Citrobacter braakii]|nr:hypothetical protein [Citrobacter braakii]